MEKIENYTSVILTDGRIADVLEIFGDQDEFVIITGETPINWKTEYVRRNQILRPATKEEI